MKGEVFDFAYPDIKKDVEDYSKRFQIQLTTEWQYAIWMEILFM